MLTPLILTQPEDVALQPIVINNNDALLSQIWVIAKATVLTRLGCSPSPLVWARLCAQCEKFSETFRNGAA
eukprot:SAG25_NODE_613_length_6536_cov_28.178033_7_plen_71_part_00